MTRQKRRITPCGKWRSASGLHFDDATLNQHLRLCKLEPCVKVRLAQVPVQYHMGWQPSLPESYWQTLAG